MNITPDFLWSILGRLNIRLKVAFFSIGILMLLISLLTFYQMSRLADLTTKLYNHPYTVSTAVLRIDANIVRIQRAMRDVMLAPDINAREAAITQINEDETTIYQDFKVVHERFLGDQNQVAQTERLMNDWKPIRDEIITLTRAGQRDQATEIVRQKETKHVEQIRTAKTELIRFAQGKAGAFHTASRTTYHQSMWIMGSVVTLAGLLGLFFTFAVTRALADVVGTLLTSSRQIDKAISEQERLSAQQASAVNETNTTMEELRASARQSSEQAENAAENAQTVQALSHEGLGRIEAMLASLSATRTKVDDIASQILNLSQQTSQIRSITDLVSGFASETKMLAMNAAVEAVRAGEHGKGFTVISVETRKLADESKRSANQINTLVAKIQKATDATVMVTEEGNRAVATGMASANTTAETFRNVTQAIGITSQSAQQISLNVRQQAVAIQQVVNAMNNLNAAAKETHLELVSVKADVHNLKRAAETLQRMI
jgi:methyl-accepting chemotaxis protein